MAIGSYDNGSSNTSYQSNKAFEPTYYSRLRFKNGNKQINVNYHSGLMVLETGSVDQNNGFKFNQEAVVYLSPFKAAMLADKIQVLFSYMESAKKIDPKKAFGVNTGMGEKVSFIGFSTDDDRHIFVTIGKFDNNGSIIERAKFQFSYDYNYSLEWDDIEANSLNKVYDNMLEIKTLQTMLVDFSRGMSGASAYGVADIARYDMSRFNKRIDQMFDKLGIERAQYNGGNRNYGGSNNFLDGASSTSKSSSYEDIEDLLG